ncbi:MAG TPA: ThiF family adenylyltransferase [Propioniciclava tarda]|nr:ThiF family adenylyltransferase [Propioniciclava tarda]
MDLPLPLVSPGPELSDAERYRYARHLTIPEIGELGQRRLRNARVLSIGAGGLGSPALLYLAAAGVGTLGIVDSDVVEIHNLQRQVLHDEASVGVAKTTSASARLTGIDSGVRVVEHLVRLDAENAPGIFADYDVVLDCTDNFAARYVINDACVALGLPEVWAAVFRTSAQVSVFWSGVGGPQLRDLFPEVPDASANAEVIGAGVLGAMTGQVGAMMAAEAIKLITGAGEPLVGRVAYLDVLGARIHEIPLRPRA